MKTCENCILNNTDACSRGAGRAIDDTPCKDFVSEIEVEITTTEESDLEKIKDIAEELRKFREGITDEKVLIGFNMAIAICNKYFGESEDKDAGSN